MEFVSERLNSVYDKLSNNVEFGYFGEGEPLSQGLPSSEYILIKPDYSPTGDPHTIVITPSMSMLQYLYDTIDDTWKIIEHYLCKNMKDLVTKVNEISHAPAWC